MQIGKPFDIAACRSYTRTAPSTGREVYVAQLLRDRKLQRASLQDFRPENDFEIRKTLLAAGRSDLIGGGCDALIPAQPPRAAMEARQAEARRTLGEGRYVHQVDGETRGAEDRPPAKGQAKVGRGPALAAKPSPATGPGPGPQPDGYRPHRRTAPKRKPR